MEIKQKRPNIGLNKTQPQPGISPPIIMDDIARGNAGVPGMWNENTGRVNPIRTITPGQTRTTQPQPGISPRVKINSGLTPSNPNARNTAALIPISGIHGASFSDGSKQNVFYNGKLYPADIFFSTIMGAGGYKQQPNISPQQSVQPQVQQQTSVASQALQQMKTNPNIASLIELAKSLNG